MTEVDRGAVKAIVRSPTRAISLEQQGSDGKLTLPGGRIDPSEIGVGIDLILNAAIREIEEETGIEVEKNQIRHLIEERRADDGYYPHLVIAEVSEEQFDNRKQEVTDRGRRYKILAFRLEDWPVHRLVNKHQLLLRQAMERLE